VTARRTAASAVALGLSATLLTGCGSVSLQEVPLPGGADLGNEPYHVTVQFRDVLDLVPQSSVKVNNVSVGQVSEIEVDPKAWTAAVKLDLNRDVKLPANATAQLKQTTLLGEKYVELGVPTEAPPQGQLADGAVIPVAATNRYPEVEEVFGALSLLLNGGGIGQVQNIARELNTALKGREGDTKALLDDLNLLVGTLDGQKANITRAIDGVDKLSARLADERGDLDEVLTDLEPGLAVLNEQRPQLVEMLKALDKLSGVAVRTINRSQEDLVADLKALDPTLRELARTGDTLPQSLEVLATPPFTDAAIKPSAGNAMNLDFNLQLDLGSLFLVLLQQAQSQLSTAVTSPSPLSTLPVAPPAATPKVLKDLKDVPKKLPEAPLPDPELKLPGLGGN
jgi:phospholipid/cholesterol/gamma-HCH transport system substrate-binding protein